MWTETPVAKGAKKEPARRVCTVFGDGDTESNLDSDGRRAECTAR